MKADHPRRDRTTIITSASVQKLANRLSESTLAGAVVQPEAVARKVVIVGTAPGRVENHGLSPARPDGPARSSTAR